MLIHGTLHTDGGARGNPGPAGIGAVFTWTDDYGHHEREVQEYIGETTNNVAEYTALIRGLAIALEHDVQELTCFLDSELVVKQMNREYRVKDKDLQSLFLKVWNLSQSLKRCIFRHIPREENKRADTLVNAAIDARPQP